VKNQTPYLFTIGNFGIGLMGGFQKFSIVNDKFKEFKLAFSFGLFGILWTVGYSNQLRKLTNAEKTRAGGAFLGITKFFCFAISLSVEG